MDKINIGTKSLEELVQLFKCEMKEDDSFYDIIAYNIAQSWPEYLLENIDSMDRFRKRSSIFGLGNSKQKTTSILDKIKSYLTAENPLLVADAIDALKQLKEKELWNEIKSYLDHESPYVRGAVMRFAHFALGEKAFDFLVSCLSDEHPIGIQNAIDKLDDIGNPAAIKHIKPFMNHENKDVRDVASYAVECLEDLAREDD